MRSVIYGGGPMYLADIEEAVTTLGPRFIQIYGQGESPMCITALSRELVADRAPGLAQPAGLSRRGAELR
jgi:hypothetical protein